MKSCQYKSSDELPLILNVQEVSNFLGLGLSQVYELVKRIDFPAFKVGSRIFVPKDKFLTWLNVQTEEKDSLLYGVTRMDDSKMPRIRRKEDLPDVMTMPLVAKTLGCSLTVAYRLLKSDGFPHTVSGQRVYIDKGKFLSWLDAQTQMEKRDHYGW